MISGLETFAKVRALHDQATIPGEKAAAMARLKVLARKAGMTVKQAMSKLDAPEPEVAAYASFDSASAFSGAFNDFFNTPEMRAARAERERERAAKRAVLLAEYGSAEAVFADTPREAALRRACAPLTIWDHRPDWRNCYTLAGWKDFGGRQAMPAAVREAVTNGWPWPETVAAAWSEYAAAEVLDSARYVFEPDYTPHRWVEARRYVLEDLLDAHPAASLGDMRARMSWLEHLHSLQSQWTHDNDAVRFATLRADIERMGARLREAEAVAAAVQSGRGAGSTPHTDPCRSPDPGTGPGSVQSGHPTEPLKDVQSDRAGFAGPVRRTNADKRRNVLALLGQGLTDREIARRAGVSPSTVGAIRRSAPAR